LAPTGTIRAFLTICAFRSPRISVRKSSWRSDHRRPAARDEPAAQVDALHPRRVDEDLAVRARRRDHGDLRRVELERQVRLGPAVGVALEEVRAQHPAHHGQEGPQDAVLVQAPHGLDGGLDVLLERLGGRRPRLAAGGAGIQARAEERDEQRRDGGMRHERLLHVAQAEVDAGLAQVAPHGP
jgi:hypothetical protein